MKKNHKNAFTLVELLAVIVILGLILIIVVPKVTQTISNSKKRTLELTARSIAKSAEEKYIENDTFGLEEEITCESVAGISNNDYSSCIISFDEEGIASVTLIGKGRYKGLSVCSGDKTEATATNESCTPVVVATTFEDDEWSTIVAAVKQAEKNETEYPYEVGNTKEVDMGSLGTHTIRVANTTPCSEVEVTSKTACGFVLEFADIITTHEMNGDPVNYTGDTNVGGWPATEIRAYLNDLDTESDNDGVIYNALPDALKTGIIETYVISSPENAGTTGYENVVGENFYSTDKLYLLSPQEVWGTSFTSKYDKSNGTSRQLDYYANYQGNGYTGVSTSKNEGAIKQYSGSNSWWWLRSAYSDFNHGFYYVGSAGGNSTDFAGYSYGLTPTFRLAD